MSGDVIAMPIPMGRLQIHQAAARLLDVGEIAALSMDVRASWDAANLRRGLHMLGMEVIVNAPPLDPAAVTAALGPCERALRRGRDLGICEAFVGLEIVKELRIATAAAAATR